MVTFLNEKPINAMIHSEHRDPRKSIDMKTELTTSIPKSKLKAPMAGRDHIRGPIDAPFTLLEYGDYQCPYCGEAYPVIKAVQERLGNKLCFAFRNFPLVNVHEYAEHAAQAAEAAGAQGQFWEMHDTLFENQEELDDENLFRFASSLGMEAKRLLSEIVAEKYLPRVRDDFQGGLRAGVNGTPTLFVNGLFHDGPTDVEALLEALGQPPHQKR
jgi:protein-disulfide isomerase